MFLENPMIDGKSASRELLIACAHFGSDLREPLFSLVTEETSDNGSSRRSGV